jgi:hypothetical protein
MNLLILKSFISLATMFLTLHLPADTQGYILPSDSKIQVMGRYEIQSDGSVVFGASGVAFHVRLSGSRLEVDLHDEFRDGVSYNWFTVVVNGSESHRFRTVPGITRYIVADGLPAATHDIILIKASEGANGQNRISAFYADAFEQHPPLPNKRIEFIGDSISCGMGADERDIPCGQAEWMDQHSTWQNYAVRIARSLQTQHMITAVSGMGMHRNWSTPGPIMPDRYASIYSDPLDATTRWDHARFQPDVVIVALGTNDFSDGDKPDPRPAPVESEFKYEYRRFLTYLRQVYPNAQILLLNSPILEEHKNEMLTQWLHDLMSERHNDGDPHVHMFAFTERYQSGCTGHPSMAEHARMADALLPTIQSFLE